MFFGVLCWSCLFNKSKHFSKFLFGENLKISWSRLCNCYPQIWDRLRFSQIYRDNDKCVAWRQTWPPIVNFKFAIATFEFTFKAGYVFICFISHLALLNRFPFFILTLLFYISGIFNLGSKSNIVGSRPKFRLNLLHKN